MIGAIGSLIGSVQSVQDAMQQAKAKEDQARHLAQMQQARPELFRSADEVAAMTNAAVNAARNHLALERHKQSNVAMSYMPYHRANTFTDEALKLMAAEPDHRDEIKAHAIECLEQFPEQAVARPFIEQLLTA